MDDFDKILGKSLKDGRRETPAFVWDNIEKEIALEKKRRSVFFWLFGCLGSLVLIGGAIAYFANGLNSDKGVSEQNQKINSHEILNNQPKINTDTEVEDGVTITDTSTNNLNSTKGDEANQFKMTPSASIQSADESVNNLSASNTNTSARKELASINQVEDKQDSNLPVNPRKFDLHTDTDASQGDINSFINAVLSKGNNDANKDPNQTSSEGNLGDGNIINTIDSAKTNQDVEFIHVEKNLDITTPVDKDSPANNNDPEKITKVPEKRELSKFFIEAKAGYSIYKMSVWDETFTVGALSKRPFKSRGYNFNVEAGYEFNRWLKPILGFNYNIKNAEFTYSALYDDHGWLTRNINGQILSIDEINDTDYLCNKHVLTDINSQFQITSVSLTVGNKMNVMQLGKFGLDLDLKYSLDINSKTRLDQMTQVDVSNYLTTSLNSRFVCALNFNLIMNNRLKLLLYPEYIQRKNIARRELYQGNYHELIVSAGLRITI
ncbi:MAG: hypothetical protein P8O05_01550 [Flavobacteriales bacterium]|nr:hypothetical protein [Flavobacteriales bacterium]MDG2246166.1 hypothetical protein [Flavobacteriales bacterium]